jgi:hypothetical protein
VCSVPGIAVVGFIVLNCVVVCCVASVVVCRSIFRCGNGSVVLDRRCGKCCCLGYACFFKKLKVVSMVLAFCFLLLPLWARLVLVL